MEMRVVAAAARSPVPVPVPVLGRKMCWGVRWALFGIASHCPGMGGAVGALGF